MSPAAATARAELDIRGRPRPLVARTRERHQQFLERIERGDSLRAIARELRLSRGTVPRFAQDAGVEELLVAATHHTSLATTTAPTCIIAGSRAAPTPPR
ncbi:hypothetical protein ACWCQQ_38600 [Streptomyces sp. NPDC002143]